MSVDTRLLFEFGLRLIPVLVKAGLAILGGGQEGSAAPVVVNLWPSLMAFGPATHAVNGVLALMCSTPQMAVHCVGSSSLIAWPVRVVVFAISVAGTNGAASLADCSARQVRSCAVAFLVSCLHSAVLHRCWPLFCPM